MAAVFCNTGLDDLTRYVLGLTNVFSLTVHLYTNNHTPVNTDTAANFTELNVGGYAAVALQGNNWGGQTAQGVSTYNYPQITWTIQAYQAPQVTVYGYYVTNAATQDVVWAELFGSPYAIPLTGGTLNLALQWVDQVC